MKIADKLTEIEVLSYYDRPLMVSYMGSTWGQDQKYYVATWCDETQETVRWFMLELTGEQLAKLTSKNLSTAITLKEAIGLASRIFFCEANTFDYGSVTEGELITEVPEEYMPSDGSYVDMDAWLAWDALQKTVTVSGAPITLIEPVSPSSPDEADTSPGAHLDWPELDTVPGELDLTNCPWKKTNFQ